MRRKQSRFNIQIRRDEDKCVWLYNSRSGAVLQLTAEHASALSSVESLSLSAQERLIEGGFLVDEQDDELLELRHRFERARYSPVLGLTVCPTLACNLRCGYCYEGEQCEPFIMTDRIADEIVNLAARRGNAGASITWYGGEPLLAKERVLGMQRSINSVAKVIRCSMITNGTLLHPGTYDSLRECGVQRFQITIDGSSVVHDTRRPTAQGKGTFDSIVKNLREIQADHNAVSIRVNVDQSNAASFLDLLRYLSADPLLAPYVKGVYPARLTNWPTLSCQWKQVCFSEEQFSHEYLSLADAVHKEFGLNIVSTPFPKDMYCAGTSENNIVIGPLGELYKCWTSVGDPDSVVGYVNEEFVSNTRELSFWRSWDPFSDERCADCAHLPTCMGGCPAMVKNGMLGSGRACLREKYAVEDLVLRAHRDNLSVPITSC